MLLGLGIGAAAPVACTLELDDERACGDGYVDRDSGEECDPGDPSSYANACVGTSRPDGFATCDPVSCEIHNEFEDCARCGDGKVDGQVGERCDGDDLDGNTCPSGGLLQCTADCQLDYSACKTCGNGVLDLGEECDPAMEGSPSKPDCTELFPPNIGKPYTSGDPGRCLDDCRWERAGCDYCGDGNLDERPLAVDPELGGDYQDCRRRAYAERVIDAYMRRYAAEAWRIGDAETVARVHNGGPNGAQKQATLGYWQRVRSRLGEPATPR